MLGKTRPLFSRYSSCKAPPFWLGKGACRRAKAGTMHKVCLACLQSTAITRPVTYWIQFPRSFLPAVSVCRQRTGANRPSERLSRAWDSLLLAVDGTEYFSSPQSHCEYCSTQTLKNGQTRYFHAAVRPVIVAPEKPSVIPLAPEFLTPQDGADKQDSELAAAKRWLEREAGHLPPAITVLGDDRYCHQPFCEQLRGQGWHFILVCKPDLHKRLYEGVEERERLGSMRQVKQRRWTGRQ
jgi:hypothetical protein